MTDNNYLELRRLAYQKILLSFIPDSSDVSKDVFWEIVGICHQGQLEAKKRMDD
jgi:hypothetical protein